MKKALVYILVSMFALSLIPAAVFASPGFDVYTSGIVPPNRFPAAQFQPIDRAGDGAEFYVSLVDNGNGFPNNLYVASSRSNNDFFFYKNEAGDWTPVSNAAYTYHPIDVSTMSTQTVGGSSRVRDLYIKVVSTAEGTSKIAFGIDAICAVDTVNGRSLTHDFSHIFTETSYSVYFTAPTGVSGGSNISPSYSYVVGPTAAVPARAATAFNNYDAGAEFTVTLVANTTISATDRIFIATSRPNIDYLYYRLGNGNWQPYHGGGLVPMADAVPLTAFTHSTPTSGSASTHEMKLKICSAVPGTSQIVFGTDIVSVNSYAEGNALTATTGLNNIIGKRKYSIEFSAAGASVDPTISANINVNYTIVNGPLASSPAQTLPLAKSDIGADFSITLVGYSTLTSSDRIYIASSRPNVDYLYYKIGTGDWQPYHAGGDIPMSRTLSLSPFTHSTNTSSNIHEIRLKVISTASGTSQIVFGVDAACVTDSARDRNLTHDLTHILSQKKFPAQFTTAYYNKNSGNKINLATSLAVGPNRVIAAQTLPLNRYSDGAEFNVTISGTSTLTSNDRLYIATSRPESDYLFYRTSTGDWAPYYSSGDIPMASALPLTPFVHTSSTSATTHGAQLKIVSTAEGVSQIVFGTDPIDVADFAAGRAMSQGFGYLKILGQRGYPAEFSAPVGNNLLTLSVNGYYNYGYGSPKSGASGEKNMSVVADQVPANNISVYTLTATVLNSGGSAAANKEVALSVASGSGVTLSANKITTNNNGKAEFTVRSSAIGAVDIFASVVGIPEQSGGNRRDKATLIFKSGAESLITGFKCEAIETGIKLSWEPLTNGAGYRLYRSDNPTSDGNEVTGHIITSSDFIDVNVKANTTYYYTLRQVISEANQSTGSAEVLGAVSTKVAVTTKSVITGENLAPSGATGGKKFILMAIDNAFMSANGVRKEVDTGRGTSPVIRDNRTVVPIRAIVEEMGGSIAFDSVTREIAIKSGSNSVLMWIDKKNITVNGVSKAIDVAPVIINERTMVPIRFAVENLGCVVEWIESAKQIVIVYY